MIKKFLNFVRNNIFLILAAYWFISFLIGIITINPSTLDATTRKIKALELGLDLLWSLVFFIQHSFYKVIGLMNEKIDLVNKRVDFIFDFIQKVIKEESEEESADKDEKEVN